MDNPTNQIYTLNQKEKQMKKGILLCALSVLFLLSCQSLEPVVQEAPVVQQETPQPVATPPVVSQQELVNEKITSGENWDIEYKMLLNLNVIDIQYDAATNKPLLPENFTAVLQDLGIDFVRHNYPLPRREYWYQYALAPNREFNNQGLIFRLREEVTRNRTRLTIKFRLPDGATPEFPDNPEFEVFGNEFDVSASGPPTDDRANIDHTFSVAFNIEPRTFAVDKGERIGKDANGITDLSVVWDFFRNDPALGKPAIIAWLEKEYPSIADPGTYFPGEVYNYRWTGFQDSTIGEIEYTIDFWHILASDGSLLDRVFELSFENPVDLTLEVKEYLDILFLDLYRSLWDAGLISDLQSSKTALYFNAFAP